MTRQTAQIGTTFIRAASRSLMQGIVLLLLFTQQSRAGLICNCSHQDESRHACWRQPQHDNPAVETHQEGSDALSSSHCASEETQAPGATLGSSPQGVNVCCHSAPLVEMQAVEVTSTKQAPVENTLPRFQIGAETTVAPAFVHVHPQRHKRPLYSAFSCWLI